MHQLDLPKYTTSDGYVSSGYIALPVINELGQQAPAFVPGIWGTLPVGMSPESENTPDGAGTGCAARVRNKSEGLAQLASIRQLD